MRTGGGAGGGGGADTRHEGLKEQSDCISDTSPGFCCPSDLNRSK
jgi:hypothetical protein